MMSGQRGGMFWPLVISICVGVGLYLSRYKSVAGTNGNKAENNSLGISVQRMNSLFHTAHGGREGERDRERERDSACKKCSSHTVLRSQLFTQENITHSYIPYITSQLNRGPQALSVW